MISANQGTQGNKGRKGYEGTEKLPRSGIYRTERKRALTARAMCDAPPSQCTAPFVAEGRWSCCVEGKAHHTYGLDFDYSCKLLKVT